MFIKEQQGKSLLDFILQLMPDWNGQIITIRRMSPTNNKAAKALFSLWKDEANKLSEKKMKRPPTLSGEDIRLMETAGLIKSKGENIEITSEGVNVIKTMILGDDKSSFEDNGTILDFDKAFANTKPRQMRKMAQLESKTNNWYSRLKNATNSD